MTQSNGLTPNKSKSSKTKKDHYLELVAIANQNGGECLDKEYIASSVKMQFKCIDNHEWSARPNDIKRGTWCPFCRSNKTENLVRQFFETIFNKPFKGASPDWLQVEGERKRILDGLNTELNIAFEYHGEQHYKFIPHFHSRNHKTFELQQERDEKVRSLCKENNIKLVEIKYLEDGYSKAVFIDYMKNIIESEFDIKVTDKHIKSFDKLPFSSSKLNELKDLAKSKNGECLSIKYLGVNTKIRWKCNQGHEWDAIPKSIKNGHWCPYCNGRLRVSDTLTDVNAIVNEKKGICLSKEANNLKDKLDLICCNGHNFKMSAGRILYAGQWCPYCSRNRILNPLKEIKDYAISRGGECLSETYINSTTHMKFKCHLNHEWTATSARMRHSKKWCPHCNNMRKGSNLGSFLNKSNKKDPVVIGQ